ncbi:MAG: nuclease [Bryobacterales bacterium]|nr:nuclease [Bryobacterales bacterium]
MRYVLGLLLMTLLAAPAYPWWETGHQTVAQLAALHLTPAARTRIARILSVPDTPEAVGDGLASASTWADETKFQTGTGNWHFIDLALQDTRSDIPARCKNDDCAPARIRLFAGELRSHLPGSRWSELDALRYVVHLVGDIHQPLHDASDADLGGNCQQLNTAFGRAKNLHSLWDGGIIGAMDVNAKSLTASLEKDIAAMSEADRQAIAAGDQDDWVWQGHQLAIEDIYGKLHIPTQPVMFPKGCPEAPMAITTFQPVIEGAYVDAMKPVVREQLTRAGLRLARLLNESL